MKKSRYGKKRALRIKTCRAVKFLAAYTLIYIVASFCFHLSMDLRSSNFTLWEYGWLAVKIPVFGFCLMMLFRRVIIDSVIRVRRTKSYRFNPNRSSALAS